MPQTNRLNPPFFDPSAVSNIRSFRNSDLPALARVWVQHWEAVRDPPPVSVAIIEQALLSRTFFNASTLTVAESDDSIQAWSHFTPDPFDENTVLLGAICFTQQGLVHCDQLLAATEASISDLGFTRIAAGPLRDEAIGYAGLAPLGHGIGVPATDSRTSSLLSRRGYSSGHGVTRMVANTSPYRIPVSREALQLRRTTRLEKELWFPADPRHASAMAHLDIEQHSLVNHRTTETLASLAVWFSDPEAQVMDCAEAILDLSEIHQRGSMSSSESFLVGSIVQSLANRRVFRVETAIDNQQSELINQMTQLNFSSVEQGQRWEKLL